MKVWNDPQDTAHTSYKIVFVQNTLIVAPENDTAPFLLERSVHLGNLMRWHLLPHRHQLRSRLARTGSIQALVCTLERLLGMPITLTLQDLQ